MHHYQDRREGETCHVVARSLIHFGNRKQLWPTRLDISLQIQEDDNEIKQVSRCECSTRREARI